VVAVQRQATFEFSDLGRQCGYLRKQRAYQPVFLGNAELVKIGQSFPNLGYRHLPHFL
jgi:hypothetical protein